MPVYLNARYPSAPSNREWKHRRKACAVLLERAEDGYEIIEIRRNPDGWTGDTSLHVYERCDRCWDRSLRLPAKPYPAWLPRRRRSRGSRLA